MKWFSNMKIWIKIMVCCMLLISFTVIASATSITLLRDSSASFDAFYQTRFRPVRELNKMFKNILQMRINMIQEIVHYQNNELDKMEERFQLSSELAKHIEEIWAEYTKKGLKGREKELADSLWSIEQEMAVKRKEFGVSLRAGKLEEAIVKSNEWRDKYRELKTTMDTLMQYQQDEASALENKVHSDASTAFILNIIILVTSIVLGILITLVLTRSISGPVSKGLAFAEDLANADFRKRIELDQDDELGKLGKALNSAADNLEQTISEVVYGSRALLQAVQEISIGNENLSQRTSEQASSLEEVASTIEETNATIVANADNSNKASDLANSSASLAQDGGSVMEETVQAISQINESSNKISEIIDVINEISFQTNLLALNAAVEAARAGEQGRGFAVVASEVRNLAQRSGSAAKEIAGLIKESLDRVSRGTELTDRAGESFKEIINSIQDVSKLVSEIAASSDEQKRGTEQINIAISELDNMTQNNAGLVEETASASEEMSNQAQQLIEKVERFKIKQDDTTMSVRRSAPSPANSKSTNVAKTKTYAETNESNRSNSAKEISLPPQSAIAQGQGTGKSIENILSEEGFQEF